MQELIIGNFNHTFQEPSGILQEFKHSYLQITKESGTCLDLVFFKNF